LLQAFTDIEKLAAGGKLLTARRVESSNVWRKQGHRSAASHIAEAAGTGLGPAINTLQAARQLCDLPGAEQAVRKGRLSEVQVKEIASAAAVRPEAEGELLRAAAQEPLSVLKLRCRRAKATGQDQGASYRAIHRSRYLRNWVDDEGAVRLDARLTPDAGARLVAAVKRQADRLAAAARRAGVREPERAHLADALVRLSCRTADAGGAPSRRPGDAPPSLDVPDGQTSASGRRAQGRRSGASGRGAKRGPSGPGVADETHPDDGPLAMVHVRVDHAALLRGHTEAGEICEIPGIGPIPVEVARELASDSILSVLVTDGVDVTAVAHAGRTIPAALRRALFERDPVCVVPGCAIDDGLEIDHLVPFADGGPTVIENLARLCQWHHYLKTHAGHRLERQGRQWVWTSPTDASAPRLC
ncbi:MAG: DUF222 domain-containing protein, partial [Acidimicrobiales bacterium]|nr:DUF222 domain-containing protein [Acidimicrobiales bacterium]